MAERKERRALTPQEVERIGDLRAASLSLDRIAAEIGCSRGSVSWYCLMNGFEPSKPRPLPELYSDRRSYEPYERGGKIVRPYTPADDRRLLQLESEGLGYAEIARRLGRQHNSIRGRLATLARHEERKASP